MERERNRRAPVKACDGEAVGAVVEDSKLLGEVVEGRERMTGVEALLIRPMAALHLTVVLRNVGTKELVADTQFRCCLLKQRRKIPLAVRETVGSPKPWPDWTHST